jgi:hypothetical protein
MFIASKLHARNKKKFPTNKFYTRRVPPVANQFMHDIIIDKINYSKLIWFDNNHIYSRKYSMVFILIVVKEVNFGLRCIYLFKN